ncbi:MAG: 23S rRNA (adenine(2503)-C(2))-methyltransferase RlmN, partial [Alphaproteobacteria bacterium]|nr:23S rRNA (adenine(2503)-C(2))-methyltransferase RlmN [Alphaproteobacteria bacterium]
VTDLAEMTNVSKELRAHLGTLCEIRRPLVVSAQISEDGTRKWLLRLEDGNLVETVFIPEEDRGTLCVSSQVGCTLTCKFCHTGTQRLVRNLTAAEIVQQVMVARDDLGEWPSPSDGRLLSNVVLMGMGEPLYNFDQVKAALEIIMDAEGISLSRRRITLSTSGVVPLMERCGAETGVNLAVSLHAVRDDVRNEIMPINKKYPLHELLSACANYPGASNARRITFEYVMLKGINDSLDDARELVRLLHRYNIPAKVNLIPFNPWPGSVYECSDWETIEAFSDYVFNAGISAPIRMPRGRDILAACGQLKSESEKKKKSERVSEEKAATP